MAPFFRYAKRKRQIGPPRGSTMPRCPLTARSGRLTSIAESFTLFYPKIDHAAFVADTDDPAFGLRESQSRAEVEHGPPIVFRQIQGGKLRDVNRSGLHVGASIVSPHFLETLREHELTGWTSYPITLTDKEGTVLDGFALLGVSGRCGPIEDDLSELVLVPPPTPGGRESRQLKGMFFDQAKWDGSDFSCPANGGLTTFLTSKAAHALKKARLTGCDLEPASETLRLWKASGDLLKQPWDED